MHLGIWDWSVRFFLFSSPQLNPKQYQERTVGHGLGSVCQRSPTTLVYTKESTSQS